MKRKRENYTTGYDINGNHVLRIGIAGVRGFSIQTNGNLPLTHRAGVGSWTDAEVRDYVGRFGTDRQRGLVIGE